MRNEKTSLQTGHFTMYNSSPGMPKAGVPGAGDVAEIGIGVGLKEPPCELEETASLAGLELTSVCGGASL